MSKKKVGLLAGAAALAVTGLVAAPASALTSVTPGGKACSTSTASQVCVCEP